MDMMRRVGVYLRQNNGGPLTCTQRRRIYQKERRAIGISERAAQKRQEAVEKAESYRESGATVSITDAILCTVDDTSDDGSFSDSRTFGDFDPVTVSDDLSGDFAPMARDEFEYEGRLDDAIGADGAIVEDEPPFVPLCTTCNVTEGPCKTKSGRPTKNHKGRG